MASASATIARVGTGARIVTQVTWTLTQTNDVGEVIDASNIPDFDFMSEFCWHATGTWNGATVSAQGSNTDTAALYADLTNAFTGTALTWTANGAPKLQGERPRYLRPAATSAGASTSVIVVLIMRRNMGAF